MIVQVRLEKDVESRLIDISAKLNRSVSDVVNSIIRCIEQIDIEEKIKLTPRQAPGETAPQRNKRVIAKVGNWSVRL